MRQAGADISRTVIARYSIKFVAWGSCRRRMQSVVIVMKEGSGTMQVGGWVEGARFSWGVRGCSRYPSRDNMTA